MSSTQGDPGSHQSAPAVGQRSKARGSPPRTTTGTKVRAPHLVEATDLAAIPTMDLINELQRRERIAMRLAIEDALAPVNDATLHLSGTHKGKGGDAEPHQK